MLSESLESTATYTVTGNEGYVRARVIESNGRMAWIQPVMMSARPLGASGSAGLFLSSLAALGVLVRWRRRDLHHDAWTRRRDELR